MSIGFAIVLVLVIQPFLGETVSKTDFLESWLLESFPLLFHNIPWAIETELWCRYIHCVWAFCNLMISACVQLRFPVMVFICWKERLLCRVVLVSILSIWEFGAYMQHFSFWIWTISFIIVFSWSTHLPVYFIISKHKLISQFLKLFYRLFQYLAKWWWVNIPEMIPWHGFLNSRPGIFLWKQKG